MSHVCLYICMSNRIIHFPAKFASLVNSDYLQWLHDRTTMTTAQNSKDNRPVQNSEDSRQAQNARWSTIHCSDAWMQSGQYSRREIIKMYDQRMARLQHEIVGSMRSLAAWDHRQETLTAERWAIRISHTYMCYKHNALYSPSIIVYYCHFWSYCRTWSCKFTDATWQVGFSICNHMISSAIWE